MTNGHLIHQEHPSIDTTGRFAIDDLLRKHGFRIAGRPKDKLPVWSRYGEELSQDESLQSLKWDDVKQAQKTEESYFNQFLPKEKKRP
jgi:hypothetical protein